MEANHPAAANLSLTPLQSRIFKLLAQGITPATVAAAVSCDPSYITQLTTDPKFMEALAVAQLERFEANATKAAKYDAIEEKLLTNLEQSVGLVYDPMKLAAILSKLTASRPKTNFDETSNTQLVQNNVLVLNLPNHVAHKYIRNSAGEVIEIDGAPLLSMASTKVIELSKGATDGTPAPKQLSDFSPEDV